MQLSIPCEVLSLSIASNSISPNKRTAATSLQRFVTISFSINPFSSVLLTLAKYANERLVTKKVNAIMVVSFVKNVALPLAPKTVDEAPLPNAAPASAPFPC